MSRFLLDTHAFLWWIVDDPRLSAPARSAMDDTKNELLLSAVSTWEIAIKYRLGKIRLPSAPSIYIPAQMQMNSIRPLDVAVRHTLAVSELKLHHHDPFDRLLVAQAQIESIPLITIDPLIRQYGVQVVW